MAGNAGISLSDYLASNYGARIVSQDSNDPTKYVIEKELTDGSMQEMSVDIRSLVSSDLEGAGVKDINVAQIPLSSPTAPLKQSGLNFMQQVDFARTRTTGDQLNYLKEKFGEANVNFDKASGQIAVKGEDGEWHQGTLDNGFASFIGSASAPIAGSISGAKIGLAAGGPLGAILGAGIGAAVGKLGDVAAAHASGIRTEFDAVEISKELGHEFLLGLAGEGVGQIVMKTPAMMARAVSKVKGAVSGEGAQAFIADTMSSLNGVDRTWMRQWMKSPSDVRRYQEEMIRWMERSKGGQMSGAANPVRAKQIRLIDSVVDSAQAEMQRSYGKVFSDMQKLGVKDVHLDLAPAFQEMKSAFKELGLINEQGEFLRSMHIKLARSGIIQANDVRALKSIYEQIKSTVEAGKGVIPSKELGSVSLKEATNLMTGTDDLIKIGKKIPEKGVSKRVGVQLAKIRDSIWNGVDGNLQARNPEAAKLFSEARQKYSARSNWLNEIAGASTEKRIESTITNIMNLEQGSFTRESVKNLAESVFGKQFSESMMEDLMSAQAGIETFELFRRGQSQSSLGSLLNTITAPITSPRLTSRAVGMLSPQSFTHLQGAAKVTNFINTLTPGALKALYKNPEAMSTLFQTVTHAAAQKEQTKQELIQMGHKQIYGK